MVALVHDVLSDQVRCETRIPEGKRDYLSSISEIFDPLTKSSHKRMHQCFLLPDSLLGEEWIHSRSPETMDLVVLGSERRKWEVKWFNIVIIFVSRRIV